MIETVPVLVGNISPCGEWPSNTMYHNISSLVVRQRLVRKNCTTKSLHTWNRSHSHGFSSVSSKHVLSMITKNRTMTSRRFFRFWGKGREWHQKMPWGPQTHLGKAKTTETSYWSSKWKCASKGWTCEKWWHADQLHRCVQGVYTAWRK